MDRTVGSPTPEVDLRWGRFRCADLASHHGGLLDINNPSSRRLRCLSALQKPNDRHTAMRDAKRQSHYEVKRAPRWKRLLERRVENDVNFYWRGSLGARVTWR